MEMATRSPLLDPVLGQQGGEAGGLLPGLFEAQALALVDDEGFVAAGGFIKGSEALRRILKDAAGLAIVRLRLELIGLACGGELGQGLLAAQGVACGHAVFSPVRFSYERTLAGIGLLCAGSGLGPCLRKARAAM